jgi:hypothetical protein
MIVLHSVTELPVHINTIGSPIIVTYYHTAGDDDQGLSM